MGVGDAAEWTQASIAAMVLIGGLITWLLGEVKSARTEAAGAALRIHERLDALPNAVVSRHENEATVKGLEQAIRELSRTITHLSDQFDHLQSEIADARIELERHKVEGHGRFRDDGPS